MATGRLGAQNLTTTSNTTLYTCPASTFTVATVNLVNRTSGEVRVRIALAEADAPTDAEWIEYDVALQANGIVERTGIVLDAGKKLVVRTNTSGVSATAYGIETATI